MPPCKWQEGALTEYKYASKNAANYRLACSHPHSSVNATPCVCASHHCTCLLLNNLRQCQCRDSDTETNLSSLKEDP